MPADDHPTVRLADRADAPALRALLERTLGTPPDAAGRDVDALFDDGYTLILPHGDGAGAAAHLAIDDDGGRLDLLVVAPEIDPAATEERLLAIADAMCVAYGRRALGITTRTAGPPPRSAARR